MRGCRTGRGCSLGMERRDGTRLEAEGPQKRCSSSLTSKRGTTGGSPKCRAAHTSHVRAPQVTWLRRCARPDLYRNCLRLWRAQTLHIWPSDLPPKSSWSASTSCNVSATFWQLGQLLSIRKATRAGSLQSAVALNGEAADAALYDRRRHGTAPRSCPCHGHRRVRH